MVELINLGWLWIIVGTALIVFGFYSLHTPLTQWIEFIVNLPFILIAEPTEEEKPRTDRPVEEVAAATPGCAVIIVGTFFLLFGILRQFTA
jgi:hypothetical protein